LGAQRSSATASRSYTERLPTPSRHRRSQSTHRLFTRGREPLLTLTARSPSSRTISVAGASGTAEVRTPQSSAAGLLHCARKLGAPRRTEQAHVRRHVPDRVKRLRRNSSSFRRSGRGFDSTLAAMVALGSSQQRDGAFTDNCTSDRYHLASFATDRARFPCFGHST
jgi:hypothetical protein